MQDSGKIKLIIVCGPTASGKTGLGAEIAKNLGGEVVSADSMQIYKGIPIATAQPDVSEMLGVPHHLIGFLEPGAPFSLAEYIELAHKTIADITARGKIAVLVGGTGLYIDSVADDVVLSDCGNTEIRKKLSEELKINGAGVMYEKLKSVDPAAAEKISENDARRIIRALEVFESTGVPFSRQNELSKQVPSRYKTVRFFMNYSDRALLYERIEKRVDSMVSRGLLEEAAELRELVSENGAGQAIGHKELYPYIDGEISLEEALSNLKRATRRYAKRQITWFSKREDAYLMQPDKENVFLKAMDILKRSDFV